MIKLSTKEKIKEVIHNHFKFDKDGKVIESSITENAKAGAVKELHDNIMEKSNS